MSEFIIELIGSDDSAKEITVPFSDAETLQTLIDRVDEQAGVDGRSTVEAALGLDGIVDDNRGLAGVAWPREATRIRTALIEVHFETEHKRHRFLEHSKWARVHQWSCKAFSVASDACVHLELREGSPKGPPINERQEIGRHPECKIVWLVKPGPEPNGRR
jgi:hypothetical protein